MTKYKIDVFNKKRLSFFVGKEIIVSTPFMKFRGVIKNESNHVIMLDGIVHGETYKGFIYKYYYCHSFCVNLFTLKERYNCENIQVIVL